MRGVLSQASSAVFQRLVIEDPQYQNLEYPLEAASLCARQPSIAEKERVLYAYVHQVSGPLQASDQLFFSDLFAAQAYFLELAGFVKSTPSKALVVMLTVSDANFEADSYIGFPTAAIELMKVLCGRFQLAPLVLIQGNEQQARAAGRYCASLNLPFYVFRPCAEFHYILLPILHKYGANTVFLISYSRFVDRFLEINQATFKGCLNVIVLGLYRDAGSARQDGFRRQIKAQETLDGVVRALKAQHENFPGFLAAKHITDLVF